MDPLPSPPQLSVLESAVAPVLGGGVAIGISLHHAACDGASSTRFFHTWATASTGSGAPPPPVIDRSLVTKDPSFRHIYDIYVGDLTSTEEMEYVEMSSDKLLATFTLSREDIQRVKDVVFSAAGSGTEPYFVPIKSNHVDGSTDRHTTEKQSSLVPLSRDPTIACQISLHLPRSQYT
ncbi:Anthranilate N-benzoyltransferase protein 2 [Triticum urartu]|uniref:Anthranilate N-benzoyltransferase protein 2 n=1 Tax=Triticum urartu TaxID=4572 RepID=M7ZBS3_TRIUA|nr:Anthranilate N-benzoyltransferase protein 2 [Triticum urartu]